MHNCVETVRKMLLPWLILSIKRGKSKLPGSPVNTLTKTSVAPGFVEGSYKMSTYKGQIMNKMIIEMNRKGEKNQNMNLIHEIEKYTNWSVTDALFL